MNYFHCRDDFYQGVTTTSLKTVLVCENQEGNLEDYNSFEFTRIVSFGIRGSKHCNEFSTIALNFLK